MSKDLVELDERITWCQGQITVLAAEVHSFVTGGAYEVTSEINELGDTTLYVALAKPTPRSFAIHAGSIVNELRATLDSLACTLAIRNGQNTKNVYFPISKDAEVFANDGRRKMSKLSEADQNIIASLKPYGGGNHMLFALHSADLLRKHQRLILASNGIKGFGIRQGTIERLVMHGGGALSADRRPVVTYSANTKIDGSIHVGIAFAEPETIARKDLIGTLNEFGGLAKSIVDLFR